MKDFMKSLFGRRVLIPVAIICLLGLFLALYYFVYTPKQQALFNVKAFRVLAHISTNLQERIENFSTAIVPAEVKSKYVYPQQAKWKQMDVTGTTIRDIRTPVKGDASRDSLYCKLNYFRNDSMFFTIQTKGRSHSIDTGKSIREILEPLVRISNSLFESIAFIKADTTDNAGLDVTQPKKDKNKNLLLYRSGDFAIDKDIIIDSLLKHNGAFLFPVIKDLTVQGSRYKFFLYPFRINADRYLLGGFMSQQEYKLQAQQFPVNYLVILGAVFLMALISLPFLKIFLIGLKENITIKDVRRIIAMIFIVPFLFVVALGSFWIYSDESSGSTAELKMLHQQVEGSFRNEISECLKQLIAYDSLQHAPPDSLLASWKKKAASDTLSPDAVVNLRDVYFYPERYKNMDGVFWINDKGVEVEKWNYVKIISPFLYLSERQYVQDVLSGSLLHLPYVHSQDSVAVPPVRFAIQPTLSKATGNYTVNIVKQSSDSFINGSKAMLIGISAKMYSVYKPVLPKGFGFCMVNNNGDVLFHSESDRALQENLFNASSDVHELQTAIINRDSAMLQTDLYGHKVKLLVTPIEGLPYQLVTYYNERIDYLFTIHIAAFTFIAESLALVGLTFFILVFFYITRKHSKLFFSPGQFDWINPGPEKTDYYKSLIYFQLAIILAVAMSLFIIPADQKLNFIMQASVLFPFTVATGYYMFRTAETIAARCREETEEAAKLAAAKVKETAPDSNARPQQPQPYFAATFPKTWKEWKTIRADTYFKRYAARMLKIIIAYVAVLTVFYTMKKKIEASSSIVSDTTVNVVLWILLIAIPIITAIVTTRQFMTLCTGLPPAKPANKNYLRFLGIALMISVLLISVFPTIGFLLFAHEQETTLGAKSEQMLLARKIQQHRLYINEKFSKAKADISHPVLSAEAAAYAKDLKFQPTYGNYFGRDTLQLNKQIDSFHFTEKYNNSIIYKEVANYIFLPDDHFDFYNNTNEYFWTIDAAGRDSNSVRIDKLSLYYSNLDDQKNPESFSVFTTIPHNLPLMRKFRGGDWFLFILSLSLFVWVLYAIFHSISRRVFLIGYFEGMAAEGQHFRFIDTLLKEQVLSVEEKIFWQSHELTLETIIAREGACALRHSDYAEWILKIQTLLVPSYEAIWSALELHERSVLYDFALDGFTNYRNIGILFSLYHKGVITKESHNLRIVTDSFRNFLISKSGSAEIKTLQLTVSQGGKWGNLRVVFYIVLLAILFFLFITKEEVSKQMVAIVTSLAAIIPLLLKLFDPFSPAKGTDK